MSAFCNTLSCLNIVFNGNDVRVRGHASIIPRDQATVYRFAFLRRQLMWQESRVKC